MSLTHASTSGGALPVQLGKDARMLIHSEAPLNLEPSLELLADAITPYERFFMRNNYAIPTIPPAAWTLTIDGHVQRPSMLTYAQLRQLPAVCMVAVLECYGNGRQIGRAHV